MNKLKLKHENFTNTVKPIKSHIVRLERIGETLVMRYFKLVPEDATEGVEVNAELKEFDPSTTNLMRQIVRERLFYDAATITSEEVAHPIAVELGRQVFCPATYGGVGERYDFPVLSFPFGSDGMVSEPYNHCVEGKGVKGVLSRTGRLRAAQPVFVAYSDKADAALDDWTLIYVDTQVFILEDATDGTWGAAPDGTTAADLPPNVELTAVGGIQPDSTKSVSVRLLRGGEVLSSYSGELQIEAVSGYVPKTRVSIANGVGEFRVMALGLTTGETLRVKVGSKNISGMADLELLVE